MNPDLTIMVVSLPMCDHPGCELHATHQLQIGEGVTRLCNRHSLQLVEKANVTRQAVRIAKLKEYAQESEKGK